MDESEILPGVMPVLEYLKGNNQSIVLGSASKNAKPILEKAKILHYFDAIVDGNDVSNAKPDPEVFLQGADKVHDVAENCIVFEDSVAGIQAANLANMISIGIGETEVLHEADYVFKDFTFIDINFIENLIKEKCV
jgi:beta-phosphoglucomutase